MLSKNLNQTHLTDKSQHTVTSISPISPVYNQRTSSSSVYVSRVHLFSYIEKSSFFCFSFIVTWVQFMQDLLGDGKVKTNLNFSADEIIHFASKITRKTSI